MRSDAQGLFWDDPTKVKTSRNTMAKEGRPAGPLPPIPDTGWCMPSEFPRLDAAKGIAIDVETYDPNLLTLGPSVRTGGYIAGLSVGTDDGGRWYFPIRHAVGPNLDPDVVLRWARAELCRPTQPKYGANLIYDLDYLAEVGVKVQGRICDVQIAEPLLDESAVSYSLDTLAHKYCGEGKVQEALYAWSARAYGGNATRKAQARNIYRSPAALVGPYALSDVDLPFRIFEQQWALLEQQGLTKLYELESDLVYMLLDMRRRGVPVDLQRAQAADDDLSSRILTLEKSIGNINVYVADDIVRLCRQHGIEYPTTDKGNPSFTGTWLERHPHAALKAIHEIRKLRKARDTFIRGYIFDHQVNGRIHCLFHALRSDEYGTVSGRFSSSMPNLQNIPSRDEEIGPLCRSMYVAEQGELWQRFDWSQIEFRLLVHYATGRGADIARDMYINDPSTDFHVFTANLTGIERKPAKNINFGLVYGMGEPTMAANLGRTLEEVKPMFETYHTHMPFVRETYNKVASVAANRGYIRTILGRRRRFTLWESTRYGGDREALGYAEACAKWGEHATRRAYTHKALNALLQGSAADIMKLAMREIYYTSGIVDALGVPLITVHDELGLSVPRTPEAEEAVKEVKRIMETCIKLQVPLVAEGERGPSWGELS